MNTQDLRLFLHLCDSLHFGRTSQHFHISSSTLSRSIQQLEQHLSCKLFERDNRKVSITPQGLKLQAYARDNLQQWETLKDELNRDSGNLQGEISLYCSVTASYSFLYDILSDFRHAQPNIAIKLHTGDADTAIERVINGQEDITIAAKPETLNNGLTFKQVTTSPLVFICAKNNDFELRRDSRFANTNFAKLPMILSEEGLIRQYIDQWFRQNKQKPNIYAQVAGHEAIVSMVSLGFGVGAVPKIVLDNSPLADKVITLDNAPQLPNYDVGLFCLKKRLKSPIIESFWQQIKKYPA